MMAKLESDEDRNPRVWSLAPVHILSGLAQTKQPPGEEGMRGTQDISFAQGCPLAPLYRVKAVPWPGS